MASAEVVHTLYSYLASDGDRVIALRGEIVELEGEELERGINGGSLRLVDGLVGPQEPQGAAGDVLPAGEPSEPEPEPLGAAVPSEPEPDYEAMTRSELRSVAGDLGLSPSGSRAELLSRIAEHLSGG